MYLCAVVHLDLLSYCLGPKAEFENMGNQGTQEPVEGSKSEDDLHEFPWLFTQFIKYCQESTKKYIIFAKKYKNIKIVGVFATFHEYQATFGIIGEAGPKTKIKWFPVTVPR